MHEHQVQSCSHADNCFQHKQDSSVLEGGSSLASHLVASLASSSTSTMCCSNAACWLDLCSKVMKADVSLDSQTQQTISHARILLADAECREHQPKICKTSYHLPHPDSDMSKKSLNVLTVAGPRSVLLLSWYLPSDSSSRPDSVPTP